MRGKFITIEGCEGSGKSTQLRLLREWLESLGVEYILTREPGGSKIAEAIRGIILDKENTEMDDRCEALLYAAARVQHLKEIVEPALAQGKLVLCDRYVDSSFAYQGYARGLGEDFVAEINAYALERYSPDLTLFLDISPEQAFARKHGADQDDRMELLGLEFHNRVYEGYKRLEGIYPRICAVDCSKDKLTTSQNIKNTLINHGIIEV